MTAIDKQITISDKTSLFFEARIWGEMQSDDSPALINLHSDELGLITINGVDFLDCLLKLRQILEHRHLFILCQGAARNVHPSGMARDMSSGLCAYSLEMDRKASTEQLVNIFDPASVEKVGTIREQTAFFADWISSSKI